MTVPRWQRTRGRERIARPPERAHITPVLGGEMLDLLDVYIARYLKTGKLRTAGMIEAQLDRLVKPRIGKLGIYDLKRSNISRMLDEIADEHGPRMADLALAYVRKAFNWYEVNGHDDDFKSPVVRGPRVCSCWAIPVSWPLARTPGS